MLKKLRLPRTGYYNKKRVIVHVVSIKTSLLVSVLWNTDYCCILPYRTEKAISLL